jgi:hypothetical protein
LPNISKRKEDFAMKFNNNEILVLGNGQLGAKLLEIVPGARNLSLPDIDFLDYEGLRDILSR